MRRRVSTLMMIVVFLLSSAAVAASHEESGYTVVLLDGSFVKAAQKPVVEDGVASVRLPNGLLARIAEDRIDWDRSDQVSYFVPAPPAKMAGPAEPRPEVTIEGPPGEPTPIPTPVMRRVPEGGSLLRVEERLYELDDQIERLRYEMVDLDRRLYVDDGPAAGNGPGRWSLNVQWELRDQIWDAEKMVRLLERERKLLLRDLQRGS